MRLLIAEDDPVLADGLMRSLCQMGHAVDVVRTGSEATQILATHSYDLLILDLGLPGMDGTEVLRRLRSRRATVPVLVVTARDSVPDRVAGLDLGADDYLAKPFDLGELEARVRALIRRGQSAASSLISHGRLAVDVAGRRAAIDGAPVDLSAREFAVLEALLLNTGRVVSRDQLTEKLFSAAEDVGPNAIEVYIHRVRRKLEPAGVTIRTIRGLGYLIEKPPNV